MSTIHHLGVSGGKDSTALLLWARYESGLPLESFDASFCDIGNDTPETVGYVAMLAEKIMPIRTLKPPMDFYELAKHKGRFPSARARFCTTELKIKPTMAHVKSLQDEGHDVVLMSGVRAGESPARALLPEHGYNDMYDCDEWRPLLHWSIDDVWAIHARYGIPRNPLYDMGAERVGCLPCVMSRKKEFANIARRFPERIDRIREMEHDGLDRRGGLMTFASPNHVPMRYRSEKWTHPKTGAEIQLTMIDDVVRWAQDEYSVEQMDLDLFDVPASCADRWGMCE